jgi:predicted  nucleic acid-binding Zn-ribbon protein
MLQDYHLTEIITLALGGGAGWLWSHLKTRRERRSDEYDVISKGFDTLGHQNAELMGKFVELQDAYVKLREAYAQSLNDNISLRGEVEGLKKTVAALTKELKKFNTQKGDEGK